MKSAAVIIPVYNRRETTLHCLERLKASEVFSWAGVHVVDDASPDGTAAAVRERFPEVTVLDGDGNLWWSGGINTGMRFAYEHRADYFIWLNDDCVPVADALYQLYAFSEQNAAIAVGQSFCPSGYHYGGHRKTYRGLKPITCPAGLNIPCDTFGGNAVCIPRSVVEKVGFLDMKNMPMDPADADYGLRAKKAGFRTVVVGDARFTNDDNMAEEKKSWLWSDVSLRLIAKSFKGKRSSLSFRPHFVLCIRHWSAWGLVLFMAPYVRFIFISIFRFIIPRVLLMKIYRLGSVNLK